MALRNVFKKISSKHAQNYFLQKYSRVHSFYLKSYNTCCYASPKSANNVLFNLNLSKRYISENITFTSDEEQTEDEDFEIGDHTEVCIRNLLNADSKDPLILQLNECASVQNVFNIIRENHASMDSTHISQAILVLWDLQKIFYKHNVFYENESNSNTVLSTNAILKNYMDQVNAHEDFDKLLQLIEEKYKDFSLDALTCSLLYLNRMGVKIKSNVMQLMIMRCEEEIKNCDKTTFPLTALSRFIVTVYSQESLYPILVTIGAMPIILHRLETCETAEDFKLLTICLNRMYKIVSMENLDQYKTIGIRLVENQVINTDDHRTIIKVLRFLNQPQWHEYNSNATHTFMELFRGVVHKLSTREVVLLFKVFQMKKEPADMLPEIQEHASKLISELDDELNTSFETTLDLLSCIVSFSSPLQRPRFEKLIRRYININLTPLSLSSLFKILYHVKSPDTKLCNHFWDKTLEYIQSDAPDNRLQNLLGVSQKFMHFSHDVGNRYRYQKFERPMVQLLKDELDSNILAQIPAKFARIASFIIAYSDDLEYVEKLINELSQMSHRFNAIDHLNVSKGLQFVNEYLKTQNSPSLSQSINTLNATLNECITREINKNNKLPIINILLRGYVFRKGNINDELFNNLLNCYVIHSKDLTSHAIKDLAFSLQINNCLVPEVLDIITGYVSKRRENLLGNTVDKVLNLCYLLGYTPIDHEEFLDVASEVIIRDKDRFSGLALLQSCLALCYFQRLPDSLIKYVFSVEFLEKLDEELSNCYAKTTYPVRVRDHLMQLNRAVCIDYPQSNVPWFHQKYVDELQKQIQKTGYFQRKVHTALSNITKNTNYIINEDIYSPYGYHIDFELKYNSSSSKEAEVQNQDGRHTRAAILLLNTRAITNLSSNLKGYYQLKQRHLEILGYTVIGVKYTEWKLLYTQESCIDYIKNKIWANDNRNTVSSMSY